LEEFAERTWEESHSEIQPFNYASIVLKEFITSIERLPTGQLLDAGPVYKDNIKFFSRKARRLYICDLYRRLDKDQRTGFPPGRYWRHLDYPDNCFDGILLWDLIDRLNDSEAFSLVKRCFAMTKPGGMIMLFTFGKQVSPGGRDSCFVRDDYQVCFRDLAFSNLPIQYRQNRDFLHILTPYVTVKSLIYRNGVREFLFQKT
jgi:hypothetical protein